MTSQGHRQLAARPDRPGSPTSAAPTQPSSDQQVPVMSKPPNTQKLQRHINRGHGHTRSQGNYSSLSDYASQSSSDNITRQIPQNFTLQNQFPDSRSSPISPTNNQYTDLENSIQHISNQPIPLQPPPLTHSSSSSSYYRSISPSFVPSRPNSRGVNFSRPSTFYKLEHTEPNAFNSLRQNSQSSSSDDTGSGRVYSPTSSPTKSSLHLVESNQTYPQVKPDDVGHHHTSSFNTSSFNTNTPTQSQPSGTRTPTTPSDFQPLVNLRQNNRTDISNHMPPGSQNRSFSSDVSFLHCLYQFAFSNFLALSTSQLAILYITSSIKINQYP